MYLGGINETDAAALYIKSCFKVTEDLAHDITFHGQEKKKLGFKTTRFAAACEGTFHSIVNVHI